MPLQSQPIFTDRILSIELIYEPIFDASTAASLIRISRTCRTAYHAVAAYTRTAYNIDRLLSRFFPSPDRGCSTSCCVNHVHKEEHARARAFRSLQARTGTLISGSFALQFFARKVWHESDLDLYIHLRHRREVGRWLLEEGYTYRPTDFQDPRFEVEIVDCLARQPNGIYTMPGVLAVLTFVKPLPETQEGLGMSRFETHEEESGMGIYDDEHRPGELKVQMIVAKNTPMECVLSFHSTCVMNVISYEKAYCLFPRATLEDHRTLASSSCKGRGSRRSEALQKYQRRGYEVIDSFPPDDLDPDPTCPLYPAYYRGPRPTAAVLAATTPAPPSPPPPSPSPSPSSRRRPKIPAFRLGWRWIDDSAAWVLALPQTGVAPPPPANASTPALAHDPVAVCNWEVRVHPGRGAVMHFDVAAGSVLRYRYLVTDAQLVAHLGETLNARMRVEQAKAHLELEEWTYYDAELVTLCRHFLHELASRRLSCLRT